MTNQKHKTTKIEEGHYEYRGYGIFRTTARRGAYNPWKVSLTGRSFATLADAKAFIDSRKNS